MKLSTLYTTVPEYIEFAWVTAPNAASQSTSGITTLTLTTEVADTGNLVGAPSSNQFTLPSGTYYYEAETRWRRSDATNIASTFSLYNDSDSTYVTRSGLASSGGNNSTRTTSMQLSGQMVLAAQKTFELRLLTSTSVEVDNGENAAVHADSTAEADQRTTIKLWKLK